MESPQHLQQDLEGEGAHQSPQSCPLEADTRYVRLRTDVFGKSTEHEKRNSATKVSTRHVQIDELLECPDYQQEEEGSHEALQTNTEQVDSHYVRLGLCVWD